MKGMGGIAFALVAGALMSVQGVFNTRVTETSSLWVSNTIVHGTGLIACIIIWWFTGKESFMPAIQMKEKLYLTGGILGAAIIYTVIKSFSSLGPAMAVIILLCAQLVMAYLIELFGLFGTEQQPFEWRRVIGMLVMIVGIVVFRKQ